MVYSATVGEESALLLPWKCATCHRQIRRCVSTAMDTKKPRNPEHCRAISEGKRGKPLTEKQRAGISAAQIGKPKSEETKQRMSEAHTGRPKSAEAIAKQIATKTANKSFRRGPIPVEIHGVRYESLTAAAKALNVSQPNISTMLKKGRPGYVKLEPH